jgi:tRNA A-37 threonylcarbamoyl transferase component Bud32
MSESFLSSEPALPLAVERRLNVVCNRFEMAWKAGQRPRIEDYLGDAPEPERAVLLHELIAVDIHYRRHEGEQPQAEEYHALYPSLDAAQFSQLQETRAWTVDHAARQPDSAGSAGRRFLEPGTLIDHYRIESLLGHGGMGEVYLAEHTVMGKKVAVKVLPAQRSGDAAALRRFLREVRVQARMSPHANVTAALHAGEYQGRYYLVMEYVPGVDLAEHVRLQRRLPWQEACTLVRQVAVGLDYIHRHDIVHRDLKPSNLLLTPDGTVKILDLGLARHRPSEIPLTDSTLTPDGAVLGSLDYQAPEQARSAAQADARSDLYSLGCTFYHLLTGKTPFADRVGFEKIAAHACDVPPSLRQQRPDVPEAVVAVVEKLLAKRPEDRYASARRLIDALDTAATVKHSGAGAQVPPQADRVGRAANPAARPEPAPPVAPPAVRPRLFRVPLLAGAGMGIVVASFVVWRPWARAPDSPEPPKPAAPVAPLRVQKFRAFLLEETPTERLGHELGTGVFAAHFGNDVQLQAEFSEPVYCFLLAFNPDGKEQLCWPANPRQPPVRQNRLDYPEKRWVFFRLNDGVGLQAFVLLASRQPLPAYDDWKTQRPTVTWETLPAKGGIVWRDDGNGLERVMLGSDLRGENVEVEGVAVLAKLCKQLRHAPRIEALAVEAFAVLRADGEK